MEINQKKELCIVHIGMPKTGSSTLQETFFKSLDDNGISYGNLPHPNQSGWLYGLFVKDCLNYHFFKEWAYDSVEKIENFRKQTKELLVEGFIKHPTEIELLSGEDLFHLHPEGIIELKSFLELYFKKIIIVAYVRPVKSFMESAFQQLLKHTTLNHLNPVGIYHPYRNFERYDRVFGRENVKLFKFEPKTFPDGDIVLDFCKKMNLPQIRAKQKVVNESISKEAVAILFTYYYHENAKTDFGTKIHMLQFRLVERLKSIGTNKFRFSNQYINKIIDTYHDDYTWIQKRLNDPLDEFLDMDDISGFSSEYEIMEYSTNYIDDLVMLLENISIPFERIKHPQTVAKLVDLLMIKIYEDMEK